MTSSSIAVASTPDGLKFAERLGATLFYLTVVEGITLTPSMRRVVLRSDALEGFTYKPGQDVMLAMSTPEGATVRRRFTIRAYDPAAKTIAVHVVTHGKGPGSRWAMNAEPGSEIEGIAPRGKVFVVPGAQVHLFVGDETFLPAAVAMIESLPASAVARIVALVASSEDERPIKSAASHATTWVHRATGGDLLAAVNDLDPSGDARAYIGGEATLVRSVKDALVARGLAADRISAKAYWRADKSNAGHGEPESIG